MIISDKGRSGEESEWLSHKREVVAGGGGGLSRRVWLILQGVILVGEGRRGCGVGRRGEEDD